MGWAGDKDPKVVFRSAIARNRGKRVSGCIAVLRTIHLRGEGLGSDG